MRDLLIVSIVAVMAVMALRRPWIGIMLWTWLSIMNPHRFSWGFAYSAPLAAIAAGVTLLGLMMTRERQNPIQGAPVKWFLALSIWITLSWLFGYDTAGDYEQWNKVMKIYFMTFIALMLLINKHHIMAFVWVTTFSLALLGAKGGIFTILHGGNYRVWGPPGTFIGDNNHFALAVIMTVPLLHFLQLQMRKKWQRHVFSALMLFCAASALGSHSRGALLAMMAMGGVLWLRSPRKGVMLVAILLVALVMLPLMPQEWWDRMGTIETYEEDASAMGRINGWLVAIEVAKHHLFGGGMSYQHEIFFLLWGVVNNDVIAAHSIYFQILGNHGFIGLFLYLMVWFTTFYNAGWLRKHGRAQDQSKWVADLGSMVQVSLVGFAVGGAFLSMPYFDLPYDLMIMVVLARRWLETRGWERDPAGSLLEYAGLLRSKRKSAETHPVHGAA
jgi:probable O-glycosylation ligase (exosortase A-associated)